MPNNLPLPDLLIAGQDVVALPTTNHGYHSPFMISGTSHLSSLASPGQAFGQGICSMLFALDTMRLGTMPWQQMLAESAALRLVTQSQRGTEEMSLRFPCFVVKNNESGYGIVTINNDSRKFLGLFTTTEKAIAWRDGLEETDAQIHEIKSVDALRQLVNEAMRNGIQEVAYDPEGSGGPFQSSDIAHLLRDLDENGVGAT